MQAVGHLFRLKKFAAYKLSLILLCVNLAGCIGATPLRRRTRSSQGVEQNFTLNSVLVGQTQRAEIESKLKSFDVGLHSTHFLVARWSVSTWAAWAFACGYTNCAGAGGRVWNRRNVIVEFDNDERVKSLEEFTDSELVARLSRVARTDEALNFSDPIQLNVTWFEHGPATITLAGNSFQFVEEGRTKKPYNFTIVGANISEVGTSRIGTTDETYVTEVIHFKEAPKVAHRHSSKRLKVTVTIPDLLILLKFIGVANNQGTN